MLLNALLLLSLSPSRSCDIQLPALECRRMKLQALNTGPSCTTHLFFVDASLFWLFALNPISTPTFNFLQFSKSKIVFSFLNCPLLSYSLCGSRGRHGGLNSIDPEIICRYENIAASPRDGHRRSKHWRGGAYRDRRSAIARWRGLRLGVACIMRNEKPVPKQQYGSITVLEVRTSRAERRRTSSPPDRK